MDRSFPNHTLHTDDRSTGQNNAYKAPIIDPIHKAPLTPVHAQDDTQKREKLPISQQTSSIRIKIPPHQLPDTPPSLPIPELPTQELADQTWPSLPISGTLMRELLTPTPAMTRGKQKKRAWKKVVLTSLIVIHVLVFTGVCFLYTYYQQQLPKVAFYAQQTIPQDTRIYDRNNVLLYEVYDPNKGGRRVAVTLQQIPKVMQDAMVATEDITFWTNLGINVQSTLRAALSKDGGASTITQQVIKNLSHNDQHTFTRKFQEATLAIGLTQKYSKAQILEMYFNVAAFGSFDIGIESAAEAFFHLQSTCSVTDTKETCVPGIERLEYNDKGVRDPILGLARASLLAGMPNEPGVIDPTLSPQAKQMALARQKIVLQAMIEQHMQVDGQVITISIARQAEDMMAHTDFAAYSHTKRAPHFVDWVLNQLALQLGYGNYTTGITMLRQGGFIVRTTLDVNLEEYVERAIDQHLNKPDYQYYPLQLRGNQILSKTLNIHSGAVVVLAAKTGEILAMDGSAGYTSTNPAVGGQYNMAAPPLGSANNPSGRPPGATMLPLDYMAAYAKGVSPYDYVPGKWYTFDEGLTNSSIQAGVAAAQTIGSGNMRTLAKKLGINPPKDTGDDFANGSENVSLLQMTDAYQVLADNGQRVAPTGVLDIYDHNGDQVYHYNPTATRIIATQVANAITTNLIDEPARADRYGDDQRLSFADQDGYCAISLVCDYPVAAQSSNTDTTESGNTTIGYTPDVVVGVWVGNINGKRMNGNVVGSTGAVPIWHSVIERALGWCGTQPTPSYYYQSDNVPCGAALISPSQATSRECSRIRRVAPLAGARLPSRGWYHMGTCRMGTCEI